MIAIPNMDKPTSCEKCPVHSFTCGNEHVLAHDYCRSLKKRFNVKKLDIDPFKEILPDCPIIEIDENDPVLLEFLNEFDKWRAYKEVMNYIKSVYKEGEANDR